MRPYLLSLILCFVPLGWLIADDAQTPTSVIADHTQPVPLFGHFEEATEGVTKFVLHKKQWMDVFTVTWQWVPNAKLTRSESGKLVCSGIIYHFNVGRGAGIPLYWGNDENPPKLVAVTDSEGGFSFVVPPGEGANNYFYVSGRPVPSEVKNPLQKFIPADFEDYVDLKLAHNSPTARYAVTQKPAKLEQAGADQPATGRRSFFGPDKVKGMGL